LDISETEITTKISDETEPELSIDIQDTVENRSQSESTKINEEDFNSDDNEDNKIVFPLSEDVEIITTTRAPTENSDTEETSFTDIPDRTSMNTGANKETNESTQLPDTSVAVEEENDEDTDELTTISYGTESATESKDSEENEKTTINIEYEITTQIQEEENNEDTEIEVMESLEPELELDISETEITTKISDETEPELSIDIQDTVENRSQSESTTMNDLDTEKEHEYTTQTSEDFDETSIAAKNSEIETTSPDDMDIVNEITTNRGEELTERSVPKNASAQDNDEEEVTEAQSATEDERDEEELVAVDSETTTLSDSTGEKDFTAEVAAAEEVTETMTDAVNGEISTPATDSETSADVTKAPRFDIENEADEGDVTIAPQSDKTTLNPILTNSEGTEATTVKVISIEETDEEVTIVTTVKPAEDKTVTDTIIEATTAVIEVESSTDNQESELDTTTVSSEHGDHEFLCKESIVGDEESDIPLECVLTNGDEERTVVIVIPRDSLGGDRDKLFNKNVKIVVKDFMVMERSPRTLS